MIRITATFAIPENEFEEKFIRASGPGGQNVNKVATAVQLRFDIAGSGSLPEAAKQRLKQLALNQITAEGELVVEAKAHRSQERNRRAAREKLARLIRHALKPPKRRKKTRPTRASERRRLEDKRMRAQKKRWRRPPNLPPSLI